MDYVISSKDFEIRFNINMITQIINWKICLFLLNVAFNNCSVISRQCLVAIGSNAHFFSTASLKYHGPDTWHDTKSSHIILIRGRPVLALPRKSECQASTILTTLVYRGPGSNPWPPIPRSRHSTDWPTEAGKTGRRLYTPAGNVFIVQYINRDEEVPH